MISSPHTDLVGATMLVIAFFNSSCFLLFERIMTLNSCLNFFGGRGELRSESFNNVPDYKCQHWMR